MKNFCKQVKEYLNSVTPEQLKENWKHLEPYENVGPNADKWIECIEK